MKRRGVLFDMDGVLLDSEKLHMEAARRVLEPYGFEIPEHLRLEFMGLSELEYWQRVKEVFQKLPSPETLAKEKNREFWNVMRVVKYSPFPGVIELLTWLQSMEVNLAVVSSTPTPQVRYMLQRMDLEKYFHIVVGGDKVSKGKPAPDIYLYAAERLGLKGSECVVIEDSKNGILSGLNAGMLVIALNPPPNARGLAPIEVSDYNQLKLKLKEFLN